jgi:protein gp37
MSNRLKAMGQEKYKNGFKLTVHPDTLSIPYTWKTPKIVFVNSMSDLFHKDIPLNYLNPDCSIGKYSIEHQ